MNIEDLKLGGPIRYIKYLTEDGMISYVNENLNDEFLKKLKDKSLMLHAYNCADFIIGRLGNMIKARHTLNDILSGDLKFEVIKTVNLVKIRDTEDTVFY